MAGILAKLVLFCVFMDREGVEAINTQKRTRPISSPFDPTNLVNKGLYRGNFSFGTRRVVPSRQDSSILRTRVANHSAGFNSSCPLKEVRVHYQSVLACTG